MIPKHSIQALLISDDPKNIGQIRALLADPASEDIALEPSSQFAAAIERLSSGKYDIVVLDLDFRDGEGLGVLLQLRESAPIVPLVVLTDSDDTQLALELLRHGAQDVLSKSKLTGTLLSRTIRFALERSRSERQQQMTLIMNDLPDSVVLDGGKDQLAKLVSSPAKCLKLKILRPARGEGPVEVFGHDYANYAAAALDDGAGPDQLIGGPVIEEILADGRTCWTLGTKLPPPHSEGRTIGGFIISRDIAHFSEQPQTEKLLVAMSAKLEAAVAELVKSNEKLQVAQSQLIQTEKLESIGRLAAGVAHEVKNPLAIIQIGIQFFAELPLENDEGAKIVLTEMREAAERANSVIESLQNFSSSRALEVREVAIQPLLHETLCIARLELAQSGIAIVTELSPNLDTCSMDPGAIEQVLLNLIDNACHAMPSGGILRISAGKRILRHSDVECAQGDRSGRRLREGEEAIVIEMRDTGVGIPEDKLSRVFDLFYTTKQTGKGKGLGLAVSRRIIDLHGGRITISNASEGGSIVTIILPLRSKIL